MRSVFGRLVGSVATGGLIGFVAWFIFGSLVISAVAGLIASAFTMFSNGITSPSARGSGGGWVGGGSSGGSWSGSSSSSSDSGSFSGGGGSFGGGGASGSW